MFGFKKSKNTYLRRGNLVTNLPICLFVYKSVFLSANQNVHLSSSESSIHYRISLISKKLATWLVYLPSSCYWRIIVVMLIMQCLLIMCVCVSVENLNPPTPIIHSTHCAWTVVSLHCTASREPSQPPPSSWSPPSAPSVAPQPTVHCVVYWGGWDTWTDSQRAGEWRSVVPVCWGCRPWQHTYTRIPGEINLSQLII